MARNSRRLARRCAVQALYQWRMTAQAPAQIEATFICNADLAGRHRDYFLALIQAIPAHIDTIDALIDAHTERTPQQLDVVEQAILRLGAFELRYARDIPPKVVMNEAIDLAKLFGAQHGYKFVNAVLDKIARQLADSDEHVAIDGGDAAGDAAGERDSEMAGKMAGRRPAKT